MREYQQEHYARIKFSISVPLVANLDGGALALVNGHQLLDFTLDNNILIVFLVLHNPLFALELEN